MTAKRSTAIWTDFAGRPRTRAGNSLPGNIDMPHSGAMNTSEKPRLGVDFGRVIHGGAATEGEEDTAFLDGDFEEAMRSPATAGMFEVLPRLVARFGGRVWVISKC